MLDSDLKPDAQPDQLSASLGAVAHLLVRIAAYLGVRLPAEITVPHNNYPQATIFHPASSYKGRKVPFPGSTPSHSSSNSPEASRTLEHRTSLPTPRALFLDRPLQHLAVEDPHAYSNFIEGVSLLAYNVAWLCRAQGLKEDFNKWEDVCPMGRNLYRLLILQESRATARPENPLDKDIAPAKPNSKVPLRAPVGLGQLSHATAHSSLNTAENVQYLSGWKLSTTKIMDELKGYLLAEQQAQEFHMVSPQEWEDMQNVITDDPIVVGEKRRELAALDDGRSYLTSTINFNGAGEPSDDASEGRRRGVRGWTKVRGRNEDAVKKAVAE